MPRFVSSSSIFCAVVVLPLPEGPESRTMGLFLRFDAIMSAAHFILSAYRLSHSAMNSLGSATVR